MAFADKTLTCRDCSVTFLFAAGEQAFYAEKGFLNDPQRCSPCRGQRRRERATREKIIHSVVCAECGVETTVPFVPKNNKPVYCSPCFDRYRSSTPVSL